MSAVKGCKCHHEEGGGVFASINQMRKGPFGVTVTAQALDKTQPSRDALDNCSHAVGVAVTNLITCKRRDVVDMETKYLISSLIPFQLSHFLYLP